MEITCPDCKIELQIPATTQIGKIISCTNCGAELEISNLNPIEIKLIEDEK